MLNYNSMQNSNPMNQQKKQPKINRPTGGATGTQASNSNTPAIKGVSSYVNPATQSQGSLTDALGGTQPNTTMPNMGMPDMGMPDMGMPTTNQLPSPSMPSSPGTPNVPTTGQMPTTGQVSPFNPNAPVSNIPQPGQSPYQPIDTSTYQQPGTISPFNPNVPLPNVPSTQGTQPAAPSDTGSEQPQPAPAQSGNGFFTTIGGQNPGQRANPIGQDGSIHYSARIKTSNPNALPQPQAGRKWALVGDGIYAQVAQDSQPGISGFHPFHVQDGGLFEWNAGAAPATQAQPVAPAGTGSTDTGGLTIGPGAETGQPDAPSGMSAMDEFRESAALGFGGETAQTPQDGGSTAGGGFSGFPSLSSQDSGTLNDWLKTLGARSGRIADLPPNIRRIMDGIDRAYRENGVGDGIYGANGTWKLASKNVYSGGAGMPSEMEGSLDTPQGMPEEGMQQPGTTPQDAPEPSQDTSPPQTPQDVPEPAEQVPTQQLPDTRTPQAPGKTAEETPSPGTDTGLVPALGGAQQEVPPREADTGAARLPTMEEVAETLPAGQAAQPIVDIVRGVQQPTPDANVTRPVAETAGANQTGRTETPAAESRVAQGPEQQAEAPSFGQEGYAASVRERQAQQVEAEQQQQAQAQPVVSALDEFKQQVDAGAVSEVPAEQAEVPAQQAEVPADLERRTEQVQQFASLKPEEMPRGFKHVGWTDDGYMVWENGNRRFIGRVEEDARASAKEYVWTKNRKRHSIQEYIGSVPLGWKNKKNHDLFLGDNGRSIYKWDAERNELQRLVNANDKEFIKSKVDRYRGTAGYSNEPITDAAKDIINTLKPGKRVQWSNFTSEYTPLSNENRNEVQAAQGKNKLENVISQEGNYSSRFSFLEGVKFNEDSKWNNVDLNDLLPEKVRNRQGLTDEDIKYLYTDPRTGGQEVFTGKDLNDLARMGLNRKDLIDGLRLLRDESGENLIFPPDKSIPGKFQRTAEIVGDIRRAEPENKWDNVEFTRLIDPNKTYQYQDPVTGGIQPQSGRDILTLASMGLNKDMLTDSMRMLRNEDGSLVFPPNQPIANEFKTVQERPEPEKKFEDLVEQYNRGDFGEVPEEQLIRPEIAQRPGAEETAPTSTDTAVTTGTTSALDEFKQQVEAGAVSEEGQVQQPSSSLDALTSTPISEQIAAKERYGQYVDSLPEGSQMVGTYNGDDVHITPDGILMKRQQYGSGAQRFEAYHPYSQLTKEIKSGDAEGWVAGDTPTYKDPEVAKQEKQQRLDELAAIKQSEPEGMWSDIDNDMVQLGGKSVDWRTLIDPNKKYNFVDPATGALSPDSPGKSILQLASGLPAFKADILRLLQNEDGTRLFSADGAAAPQAAQPVTAMDEFKQQVDAGAASDVSVANKAARANLFDTIQGKDGQLYSNSSLTFPVTTAIKSNDGVLNERALEQGIVNYENFSGEVWDRYQQTLPQDVKNASNQVLASNAALRNLVTSLDNYDVNKEMSLVGNNPNATLSGKTNYISHPAAKIHVYDAIERSVERGGYELPSSKESLKNFAFTTDNGTQMVPVWLGTRGSTITNQEHQRMVAIPLEKAEAEWDLIFGNGRPQDISSHIFTNQGFSALSAVPPSHLTEQDKQQLEQFMAGDLDENLYSHARANPTTGTYNTNAFGKSDFTRYHTKGYINGEPIVQTRKVNPNGFGNLPADIMPQQQVREDRSAAPGSPLARLEAMASGATEIPEISQPGEQAAATEVPQSTWDNAAQSGFHDLTPEQLAEIRERNRQKQAEQPEQTPERRSDAIAEMEQGLVEEGVFDEDKPVEEQPAADVVPQETAEMQQARDDYAKNIVGRFQGNPVIVEDGKVFMEQNGERVSLPDSPLSQYVMAMTEMKNPADAGINQRYLNQIRSQFEPAGSFSKAMHGVDMNLPEGFRSGGMLSEDQRIRQDRLRGEQRQQEQAEQIANFTLNPLDKQVADYQRFQQERDDAIAQLMGTDVGNNVGQYIRNLYAQAEEVGRAHQRDEIPAAEAFNQQKALMDKARALQDAQKINADKLEKYKSIFVTGEPVQDEYYEQWRAKRDAPAEGSPLGRLQQITSGINPDTGEAIRPTIEERPDPERPVIEERPADQTALQEFADKVEAGEVSDPEVGQPQPPAPTPGEVETTPVAENAGDNQAGRPALEQFAEQVEAGAVSDPTIGQQKTQTGRVATDDQRRAAATQGLDAAVRAGMFEALPRPGGRGLPTVQQYQDKRTGEVYTESQALDFFENQIFKDNLPRAEAPAITSPGLEQPTVVEPQDPNPVADAELEQVLQDGNLPGASPVTSPEQQAPSQGILPEQGQQDVTGGIVEDEDYVPSWEQGPRQYFRAGQYTPEQQDLRNQYRDMLGGWISQMPQAPGGLINPMQLMLQGMMGGMGGQFNPINPNIGNFYNPFMGLNLIGSLLGGGGLQGGMQDQWNVQPGENFLGDMGYRPSDGSFLPDSSDVTGAESNMGFAPEGAVSIAPQQDDPPATSDDDEPLTELPDPSTDIRDIVGTDNMIDVSPGFTREELTRRDVSPAQVQAMANQAAAQARQRGYEQSLRAGMPGRGRSADAGTFSQFGAGPLAQSLLQAQQAQIAIPFEQQMAYNQARRQREQVAHQLGLAQSGLIGQDYYRRAYDQLADQQMRSQLMQALLNPLLGGLFF